MSVIDVNLEGSRADLHLNRPEVLNAFDFEMFDAFGAAVDRIAGSEARVCVISGEGKAFSSGIDVGAFGSIAGSPREMIARAQAGYRALAALPIPVIAKVHGYALGAGLQVALACDLRVVASDARLGLLETNFGLIPDLGGSTALPLLVGTGRAKKMIWTAERIDGDEAGRIGLAEIVVPPEDLDGAVEGLIDAIVSFPSVPITEAKRLIDRAHLFDAQSGMDAEAASQERCLTDPAFSDALRSGLERLARRG